MAWQPLQHKTFSINSKSFATTIVSFMTVGPKSRLQNLPLLSCNTSDISESNLQLSLSSFSQELRSSGVAGNSLCFSADLNCKVTGSLLIRTGRAYGVWIQMNCKNFAFETPHLFPDRKAHIENYSVRKRGLCLLYLSGLSPALQLQAIITNHPRNTVRGHACVTFMRPQVWRTSDLCQTWDKSPAINHPEADHSPESRINVDVILRAIISLITCHYVVKTEPFSKVLSKCFFLRHTVTQKWLQQLL